MSCRIRAVEHRVNAGGLAGAHPDFRRFRGNIVTLVWHTAHKRFRAIVSRKPGTRQTEVYGQLCHENLPHDTQTFEGNCVT